MIRTKLNFLLFSVLLSFLACSEEETAIPVVKTIDVVIPGNNLDIGNDQNSTDVYAVFSLNTITGINKIEVVLASLSQFVSPANLDITSIASSSKMSAPVNGLVYKFQLQPNLTDFSGNTITHGQYKIIYLITQNGEQFVNQRTGDIELTDGHIFAGRYSGTWDDNIYSDFGISTVLTDRGSSISGSFYYSSNYIACCGGPDDGMITLKFDQSNNITSFTYNQTLDSFMGGACPGTYTGAGMVTDFINLQIDFEGDDCEGPHTGGSIKLTRVE